MNTILKSREERFHGGNCGGEEHAADSRVKVESRKPFMIKVETGRHVEVQEEIDREGDQVWITLLSDRD